MKKLGLVLIFTVLVAASGCTTEQVVLEEVTTKLKWVHQAQFAGNYMAIEKGFYEEEGLEMTLEQFSWEDPALDAVLNGDADFGISGADEIILSRAQGKELKAIAVIYKVNPVCAYTLADSGIKNPQDFIGKTVGIERGDDGTDNNVGYLYYAMMSKLGINRSQVNEVTIGYDATELLAGETDVSTGYIINEPHQAIEAGYGVETILMAEYGVNMYADVIYTRDDVIENKPELVEKFLRATLRGWQYAIENEAETVDTILKYATDRTRSHEEYMLRTSIPLIHTGDSSLGWMEESEWSKAMNILKEQGILKTKPKLGDVYTMEFLEKIYNE